MLNAFSTEEEDDNAGVFYSRIHVLLLSILSIIIHRCVLYLTTVLALFLNESYNTFVSQIFSKNHKMPFFLHKIVKKK